MGPQDGRLGPAYTEPLALSHVQRGLDTGGHANLPGSKPWNPLENLWESYGKVAEHI